MYHFCAIVCYTWLVDWPIEPCGIDITLHSLWMKRWTLACVSFILSRETKRSNNLDKQNHKNWIILIGSWSIYIDPNIQDPLRGRVSCEVELDSRNSVRGKGNILCPVVWWWESCLLISNSLLGESFLWYDPQALDYPLLVAEQATVLLNRVAP